MSLSTGFIMMDVRPTTRQKASRAGILPPHLKRKRGDMFGQAGAFWRVSIILGLCVFSGGCFSRSGRSDTTINDGWRFIRRDEPQAKSARFDDSRWQRVTL